jgi:hypothetical protein
MTSAAVHVIWVRERFFFSEDISASFDEEFAAEAAAATDAAKSTSLDELRESSKEGRAG